MSGSPGSFWYGFGLCFEPHTLNSICIPVPPRESLKSATLALLAGYLVQVVKEKLTCDGCLEGLKSERSPSLLTGLIFSVDRGGLSYPTSTFVGFIVSLEEASLKLLPNLMRHPQPLKSFLRYFLGCCEYGKNTQVTAVIRAGN